MNFIHFYDLRKKMNLKTIIALCSSAIFFVSCNKNDETAKPMGQVRLEYPQQTYVKFAKDVPYTFQYSNFGKIIEGRTTNSFNIVYPKMNATIFLTYFPVKSSEDLAIHIKESEKFVQDQTVKASFISPQEFTFPKKRVFGTMFELGGESAINIQFHATDSTNNFLSGSVYFKSQPKPDSLAPAIDYLKADVKKLIETLEWKK
ncbi:gliding motility-associated lipoprotein GldD [Chishuiella changwenlii]|uniref:Gliding motility lipoprotein GldD n=1 Tax=Chishuiella changwenlii TaxID=1434701 RepID=A0A1M6YZY7_9FLAO|nr:gliding motility lipoprotein GldD [Chishuiella changwenlii]GGE87604.1 gliding motility lipoprotein GldD [Chishuiella changwenlii]SHL23818.1 gliding motility-associated lipoprotein GldD [Chishuiella changwenlii]